MIDVQEKMLAKMSDRKKAFFARFLEENPELLKGRDNIYKNSLIEEGKEDLLKHRIARVEKNDFGKGTQSVESMGVLA
jgi:hypothetical protein